MVARWSLVLLAGCGRVGFGPGDIEPGDAPAASDAGDGSVTATFGEAPGTTFSGVTRDTYISNAGITSTFNFGAAGVLMLDRDDDARVLLAFDVTAIPPGVTVASASLTMTIFELAVPPPRIDVSRLLEDWDEGAGMGSAGAASFVSRMTFLPWLIPGAGEPLSSTGPVTSFAPVFGTHDYAVPPAVVQAWIDMPNANRGLVLKPVGDGRIRLVSSESARASERPALRITYVP